MEAQRNQTETEMKTNQTDSNATARPQASKTTSLAREKFQAALAKLAKLSAVREGKAVQP